MSNGTSIVALVPCDSYDPPVVEDAARRGIDLIGGLDRFVKSGETILLKPNVLIGSSPEKGVCTHPSILRAAATIFREAGAELTCGDSPAAGGCSLNMRIAGLKAVADEMDIPLADFSTGRPVSYPEALLYHQFTIAECALAADGIISLPRLKTHGLTRMTGAVKNIFGCVPGMIKAQQHSRLPDPSDFATMLVDLNTLLKPRLHIMDAVMAMEGNGPRSGNQRKLGVLIISDDPVAVDAVACRLIDLDPEFVPTSEPGERSGVGNWRTENIEVRGAAIDDYMCRDFDVVRKPPEAVARGPVAAWIKNRISPRPVIGPEKCTKCGTCIRHCPVEPKAVNWQDGNKERPPVHNYTRCIRCFCCQELCPEGAISIRTPVLGRLFF